MPDGDKIRIKLQVMEHVNQRELGHSIGEDSLITHTPRNATCYAMTERVITAVLTKEDYQNVLAERDVHIRDIKVAKIKQFDLFKNIGKKKLEQSYRLFYHHKTNEPFTKKRNEYLYREG